MDKKRYYCLYAVECASTQLRFAGYGATGTMFICTEAQHQKQFAQGCSPVSDMRASEKAFRSRSKERDTSIMSV